MKICPRCQKTYTDDNLNFCLEDGTVLTAASSASMPDTVYEPRPTQPQSSMPSQPSAQPAWNTAPQNQSAAPKKSSKTWVWVLLILGMVVLLCGGGLVAAFFWAATQVDNANSVINVNKGPASTPASNKSSNPSTSDRASVESLDLNKWVQENSLYGNTDFEDNELVMSSRKRGYYYALAGTAKQVTVGSDSRVSVRNIDNESTNLGYGLVFHSSTTPLQQGYAFLIDSKKKRYRVVHHSPGNEDPVINWTKSDAILDGSQWNTLEVRDKTDEIELYINDKMVKSIKNTFGYPSGVIGLYAADGFKTGFRDMEIRH
jgi:Domain of Unknown Function (DUF1080)